MAGKFVVLAFVLSVCKGQTQSSCGCGQSQNQGIKASPQLRFGPGCNLQTIPFNQFYTQSQGAPGSLLQKAQATIPKQNIQVTSVPQIPSSPAQCAQPCSQPVSTITTPSTCTTTDSDKSLCNILANALQIMIANEFIKSATSNNIVNQECVSIPVVETCVPGFDLSCFVKNLNAKQIQTYEQAQQTPVAADYDTYDWGKLLCYLNGDKEKGKKPEPEDCQCKYRAFFDYLKGKGKTACEITQPQFEIPTVQCVSACQCNDDSDVFEAIAALLSYSNNKDCSTGNVAQAVLPCEIPAQLICNYGYVPTTVPVMSFSVQPIGDPNCNYIVGSQPFGSQCQC